MDGVIRAYMRQKEYGAHVIEGGLPYLVSGWEQTAREVEVGYNAMDVEFINDIAGRQILHEVLPLASKKQRVKYDKRIENADARFLAATIPDDENILSLHSCINTVYTPDEHWWYFRIPRVLGMYW